MRGADPRGGPLAERTLDALDEVARAGGKAIVLVNRRGFAPYLSLPLLRASLELPELRRLAGRPRPRGRLPATTAGTREPLPPRLPGLRLGDPGAGGRRHRADRGADGRAARRRCRSSASTPTPPPGAAPTPTSSSASSERPRGVLVGTQMVAKGHDFPEVTLSVSSTPTRPCGSPTSAPRSGPSRWSPSSRGAADAASAGGTVLVQTLAPTRRSIPHAAGHDAAGFLEGELERRRALRYPPFAHLIRVELAGDRRGRVEPPRPGCARRSTGRCRRAPTCSARRALSAPRARPPPVPDQGAGGAAPVAAMREPLQAAAARARPARAGGRRRRRRAVGLGRLDAVRIIL